MMSAFPARSARHVSSARLGRLRWVPVVMILLAGSSWAAAGQRDDSPVSDLEREVARALHAGDRERLDGLLSEDFVLRGSPDVTRATWIDNAMTLCWGERFDFEEFAVRRIASAHVASFIYTSYQDPRTCEPATIRSLVTSVWVPHEGSWRLSVRHSGPVGEGGVALQYTLTPPPPPVLQGSGELSLVATAGNQSTQTVGAATEAAYRPGAWSTDGRLAFVRTETGPGDGARAITARLRQSRRVATRLEVYLRGGYRLDEFSGIDFRLTGEGGLAYNLLGDGPHTLLLDTGLGYLDERRRLDGRIHSLITTATGRYRWRVSDQSDVSSAGTLTFRFEEPGDWRTSNTASVTLGFNRRFSFKIAHELNFLNDPVPGFRRVDQVVSAALVTRFQR